MKEIPAMSESSETSIFKTSANWWLCSSKEETLPGIQMVNKVIPSLQGYSPNSLLHFARFGTPYVFICELIKTLKYGNIKKTKVLSLIKVIQRVVLARLLCF